MVCLKFGVILSLLFACSIADHHSARVRICVPKNDLELCKQMESDVRLTLIQCIAGRDILDCLRKVDNGDADVVNLGGPEVYVAGSNFSIQPLLQEFVGNESDFRYEGVAVIRHPLNVTSLPQIRNLKTCYTGYGRNAGWKIPVGQILGLQDQCGDLQAVAGFFGQSCVPGKWSPDRDFDIRLRQDYPNLCSLCKRGCSPGTDDEEFIGYLGALRCLTEGGADIAFTKKVMVDQFFKDREDVDNYRYLCLDGSRDFLNKSMPCFFGARPTNVMAASSKRSKEFREALAFDLLAVFNHYKSAETKPKWYGKIFPSFTGVTDLQLIVKNYQQYLQDAIFDISVEKPKPESCQSERLTWCVTSEVELNKCEDFSAAAFASSLRPKIACNLVSGGRKGCFQAIKDGLADIVTLDGGDVYTAGRHYNLRPILSEIYSETSVSYFAVAAIHVNSSITSLADLKGKKSCHTGYGRMAGWNSPIGTLADKGFLKQTGCALTQEVTSFFAASCVPGASPNSSSLCSICQGDGQGNSKCEGSEREIFSGYTGAFRCLASGAGDVAFVKHTTVPQNTDGNSQAEWASQLKSADYRLLCPDDTVKPIDQYEKCYWNLIPAHQVMTSDRKGPEEIKTMVRLLLDSTKAFGPNAKTKLFNLFEQYEGTRDLLFKDTVTGLKALSSGSTAESVLGDLYRRLEKIECKKA